MADLINTNMTAAEVVAALNEYDDFSVDMTATQFVAEVNTAFPDADVELSDTASDLVDKINNAYAEPSAHPVLKFLHYSDPHQNPNTTVKADKMMTDANDADSNADIAFALLTGDNQAYGNNGIGQAINAADKGKHLVMMGNHDAAYDSTYSRANHAAVVSALEGFMTAADVIWGDTKSAKTAGYWHKDFQNIGLPNNGKVRLIATDEYEIGGSGFDPTVTSAQVDWLCGLLDELGEDDYIILATHKPPFSSTQSWSQVRRANKFCSCHLWSWDSASVMNVYADIINAYMTGGSINNKTYNGSGVSITVNKSWANIESRATFLCFLCGHVHGDFVMPHPTHSNLLVMGIDTCKASVTTPSYDETDLLNDERDLKGDILLNKVTVDFRDKTIRIDRIGAKEVGTITYDGKTYPAVTRDNIVFDFNANVKSQNGIEEGGES